MRSVALQYINDEDELVEHEANLSDEAISVILRLMHRFNGLDHTDVNIEGLLDRDEPLDPDSQLEPM